MVAIKKYLLLFSVVIALTSCGNSTNTSDRITMEDEVYRINHTTNIYEVDRNISKESLSDNEKHRTESEIELVYVDNGKELVDFSITDKNGDDTIITIDRTMTFRQWYDVKTKNNEKIQLYIDMYDLDTDGNNDVINFEIAETEEKNSNTMVIMIVGMTFILIIAVGYRTLHRINKVESIDSEENQ